MKYRVTERFGNARSTAPRCFYYGVHRMYDLYRIHRSVINRPLWSKP